VAAILIVEDDPLIRRLLASALARERLLVHTASDGVEARELLGRMDYAIVLLDLMMPRVNGFEVLETMRGIGPRRPLVFVLTAYDRGRTEGLDAQLVQAVVRKPFDLETLVPIVSECAQIWSRQHGECEVIAPPPPPPRSSLLPGC
jgi:DNA-binding response OmpR family regulator